MSVSRSGAAFGSLLREYRLAAIQPHLDPAALDTARNAGQAMSLDEVMAEAWAFAHDAAGRAVPPDRAFDDLVAHDPGSSC